MTRLTTTQTRTFNYGTPPAYLLLSATNPENGTVTDTYNSYNKIATRVDAKGQKVVYTYDSLARLTKVQRYPTVSGAEDTCQQENYYYDSNPFDSTYSQNVSGRLAAVQYYGGHSPCDTTFTEMYSYNSGGKQTGKRVRLTRSGLTNLDLNGSFAYGNEGRMTGEQYPLSGPNLTYTFDSMGRVYSLSDGSGSVISSASYTPDGQMSGMAGPSWGTESRSYNSILQLKQLTSPGLNVQYNYPATGNNGKIGSQTDILSGEQISYVYDSLNRLASATSSQSWSQTFTFDGFGNLTNVAGVNAPGLGVTYNGATNQQTTDCADANGNILGLASCVGSNAYTYDIENRLTAPANAGGMRYSYAPGSKRVWRGNGGTTDEVAYWNPSGQRLSAYALSANSGALVGAQSVANYYFGSRLIKNAKGWVYQDRRSSIGKFYPFGQERPSGTQNGVEKFTGYLRDAETGLDYADQRYEQPGVGRFLTTDPLSSSARANDPGTWNRYAYVVGDPINRIDLRGTDDYNLEDNWGEEGGGGCSDCWNYSSSDITGYDAEGNPIIGDPNTVNAANIVNVYGQPDPGNSLLGTIINSLVPNVSVTLPVPFMPLLGVQFEFAYMPASNQVCASAGVALSPTMAAGVNVGAYFDPTGLASSIMPGPSMGGTLQQNPGLGLQAATSSGNTIVGPTFGVYGLGPAAASLSASYGSCTQP